MCAIEYLNHILHILGSGLLYSRVCNLPPLCVLVRTEKVKENLNYMLFPVQSYLISPSLWHLYMIRKAFIN